MFIPNDSLLNLSKKISSNISRTKHRKDLNLNETVRIFIFFYLFDSWLYLSIGFDDGVTVKTCNNRKIIAIVLMITFILSDVLSAVAGVVAQAPYSLHPRLHSRSSFGRVKCDWFDAKNKRLNSRNYDLDVKTMLEQQKVISFV